MMAGAAAVILGHEVILGRELIYSRAQRQKESMFLILWSKTPALNLDLPGFLKPLLFYIYTPVFSFIDRLNLNWCTFVAARSKNYFIPC